MRKSNPPSRVVPDRARAGESSRGRPDVIVEFLFDRGCFLISVNNIGNGPALKVAVQFDKKITSPDGKKELTALPLFKNIEFLGPNREIVAFVDASSSYFRRKQPTKISTQVTYRDINGEMYELSIKHDLEIYRELPYPNV